MPENDFWVLAVSPHPDDECLTGLLPLRLAEECGAKVAVWAASYGSAEERREERRRELRAACEFLGGTLLGRGTEGATVEGLAEWWRAHPGALVVCPHERDGHPRHRATHRLVRAAADGLILPKKPLRTAVIRRNTTVGGRISSFFRSIADAMDGHSSGKEKGEGEGEG